MTHNFLIASLSYATCSPFTLHVSFNGLMDDPLQKREVFQVSMHVHKSCARATRSDLLGVNSLTPIDHPDSKD